MKPGNKGRSMTYIVKDEYLKLLTEGEMKSFSLFRLHATRYGASNNRFRAPSVRMAVYNKVYLEIAIIG